MAGLTGAAPKDLLQKQMKWANNGEYDKIFQSCTPSYRASNTLAALESEIEAALDQLGISKLGVKDVSVTEEGNVANASFIATGDGQELGATTNRYRKIDGVWYDDQC